MTREELNNKLLRLKQERQELLRQRDYYSKCDNIYFSITNIMKTNMLIENIEKKIEKYNFYDFDEEFVSFIIYMINEIENANVPDDEYLKEEFHFIEFSNTDVKLYNINDKNFHHVVSVIAKYKDIESIKMKQFDNLYKSNMTMKEYDSFINGFIDNIDGLVVDVRDYQQFSEEHYSSRILIRPNIFIYKFSYISEFLYKLLNYRLEKNSKDIEINYIVELMNNIIEKYRKLNKVMVKKH